MPLRKASTFNLGCFEDPAADDPPAAADDPPPDIERKATEDLGNVCCSGEARFDESQSLPLGPQNLLETFQWLLCQPTTGFA